MAKEQTQSLDLRPGKRMAVALSNENLRIGASTAWQAKIAGTLDESRMKLDFEVGKGGVIKEIDKTKSIPKRIKAILDANGIQDPNEGLTDEQLKQSRVGVRTYASFILQGSHDTMERLAFGDQKVDYNPGADNSALERKEEIEKWAIDMYRFMAKKYGEENIASFVVHLDETTPHAHCIIVPITESKELSFRKVFAGKDKYEFAKRTKQIWDEAAAIANKYGMKRGEDKNLTGNKHKSYLQWLKEQIFSSKKKLDEQIKTIGEQEKDIEDNNNTIVSQRQQIYFLNGQIKQAEKKLKSFQTMIKNFEAQQQQLEQEIASLNEQYKNGKISNEELERRTRELNTQISEINTKLVDKKNKLTETEQTLNDLREQKSKIQEEVSDLQQKKDIAEKELPEIFEKAQSKINDTFYEVMTDEAKKDYNDLEDFSKKLPANLRNEFESIMENSVFSDLGKRGEEMAGVAAALFLGYIDQATSFAHGSGGGGGHPGNWGRKKDEDDEAFARRCCIMGRMMMRPAGRKLKRS